MQSYTGLEAWKVGLDLVEEVYELTKFFPCSENFGMIAQIRKSSTSVLANLAEGFGRFTYADKANKYTIARGECSETEAFLHIAIRLKFLDPLIVQKALQLAERERRLLSGLIQAARHRE